MHISLNMRTNLAEIASFAALPADLCAADITRELQELTGKRLHRNHRRQHARRIGQLALLAASRTSTTSTVQTTFATPPAPPRWAAITAAVEGLIENAILTAVITGGIDRNMGIQTFVKFCKIGALSATGTRPYAEGADGFVMGEGSAIFLLKRLADAERDGDKIYAVLRGIGASSDGKGKGITAPNPVGQKFCLDRAWQNAGLSPATATMIEGHGTSTKVGDVVEAQCMTDLLSSSQAVSANPLGGAWAPGQVEHRSFLKARRRGRPCC